jgi:hypothetical protein
MENTTHDRNRTDSLSPRGPLLPRLAFAGLIGLGAWGASYINDHAIRMVPNPVQETTATVLTREYEPSRWDTIITPDLLFIPYETPERHLVTLQVPGCATRENPLGLSRLDNEQLYRKTTEGETVPVSYQRSQMRDPRGNLVEKVYSSSRYPTLIDAPQRCELISVHR